MHNKKTGAAKNRPLKSSNTMTYNEWIQHLRNERKKIAEKLERLGDKPVMSQQERQRIADKTRTTIHNQ